MKHAPDPSSMDSSDSSQTIFMSRPEGLARILALDDTASGLWTSEELSAIWQHQLSAPVQADLGAINSTAATQLKNSSEADPFWTKTFAELFDHPHPPVGLLNLVKEFAKKTLKESDDGQLNEVARALYYASYAAGMVRCGKKIGSFKDDELKHGYNWALKKPWLVERTKKLISEARDLLKTEKDS